MRKLSNLLKHALLLGAIMCCFSCRNISAKNENNTSDVEVIVVIIDSCEYYQFHTYNSENITHKGNCKFCAKRSFK